MVYILHVLLTIPCVISALVAKYLLPLGLLYPAFLTEIHQYSGVSSIRFFFFSLKTTKEIREKNGRDRDGVVLLDDTCSIIPPLYEGDTYAKFIPGMGFVCSHRYMWSLKKSFHPSIWISQVAEHYKDFCLICIMNSSSKCLLGNVRKYSLFAYE